ncbi:unnamed protein product [Choristocarpus tenellus]
MRKRLSLPGGFKRKERDAGTTPPTRRNSERLTPRISWSVGGASWIKKKVERAVEAVNTTVDKSTSSVVEDKVDGDMYYSFHARRSVENLNNFLARYKHLVETIGDLGLAADQDSNKAVLLENSGVQGDLDALLSLLRAEDKQNSRVQRNHNEGSDEETSEFVDHVSYPCLEFVLEKRVVKFICELGCANRPDGTMAIMLGACASLLGQVSHPLLPSQSVHEPISKLVAAANTYLLGMRGEDDGGVTGAGLDMLGRGTSLPSLEMVQTKLACLLGAIWRRLLEDSAQLDYFIQINTGKNIGAGRIIDKSAVSLEIFSSLLPLVGLPGKPGQHAREACLLAVSVKDPRSSLFIARHTTLCEMLASTLAARYRALATTVEEPQKCLSMNVGVSPAWDVAGGGEREGGVGLNHNNIFFSRLLLDFVQHLRFCNAVGLNAVEGRFDRPVGDAAVDPLTHAALLSGNKKDSCSDSIGADVAANLLSEMKTQFLDAVLGPALVSFSESHALAAQAITTRIVTELSVGEEGYGVYGRVGLADNRQQRGSLLEELLSFLLGPRKDTLHDGGEGTGGKRTEEEGEIVPSDTLVAGSGSVVGGNTPQVGLRRILIGRVGSDLPTLRVSTLGLMSCLVELRDDCVLLELALGLQEMPLTDLGSTSAGSRVYHKVGVPRAGGTCVNERGQQEQSVLMVAPERCLGLRVSPSLIDEFCGEFVGSSIHPDSPLRDSNPGLEGYLFEAHRRQIQQLTEGRAQGGMGGEVSIPLDGSAITTPSSDYYSGLGGEMRGGECIGGMLMGRQQKGDRLETSVLAEDESGDNAASGFVKEYGEVLASTVDTEGSLIHALFNLLEAAFDRELEENVALTGVLSSLCLAATATELSPARRLLFVLLFDGTPGAPFRSMRRILQRLWTKAQNQLAQVPDPTQLLAKVRMDLGMVPQVNCSFPFSGKGSEGVRTEARSEGRWRFLRTVVFLEEFLKEVYCILQAKNHVECGSSGLSATGVFDVGVNICREGDLVGRTIHEGGGGHGEDEETEEGRGTTVMGVNTNKLSVLEVSYEIWREHGGSWSEGEAPKDPPVLTVPEELPLSVNEFLEREPM